MKARDDKCLIGKLYQVKNNAALFCFKGLPNHIKINGYIDLKDIAIIRAGGIFLLLDCFHYENENVEVIKILHNNNNGNNYILYTEKDITKFVAVF